MVSHSSDSATAEQKPHFLLDGRQNAVPLESFRPESSVNYPPAGLAGKVLALSSVTDHPC